MKGDNNPSSEHALQESIPVVAGERIQQQRRVPLIIISLNYVALGLLAVILVPAAVIQPYQFVIVIPALALLVVLYWWFQHNPAISSLYFALSLSLVLWIIVCEQIVTIDNVLGTNITRELRLGLRLQTFAKAHLKNQRHHREACCGTPLSYHYQPGSPFWTTFDCQDCNEPYEAIVDQTGYLNQRHELIEGSESIDLFVAGDSVLQGYGVVSVVEYLNDLMPINIWNLSSSQYGTEQKVSALISYALPRHPRWVLLDFYSDNDIHDAILNEICRDSGTFMCVLTPSERDRRLFSHPLFSSLVDTSKRAGDLFENYTDNSLTLAVTRYLISHFKAMIKRKMGRGLPDDDTTIASVSERTDTNLPALQVSRPGNTYFPVIPARKAEWMNEGMRLVFDQFDRLADEMADMSEAPAVILLYTPSAYEVYRDVMVEREPEIDRASELQVEALKNYASHEGWAFLDLTASLRGELALDGVWIYGMNDRMHWSPQGTRDVAPVLARELSKILPI